MTESVYPFFKFLLPSLEKRKQKYYDYPREKFSLMYTNLKVSKFALKLGFCFSLISQLVVELTVRKQSQFVFFWFKN